RAALPRAAALVPEAVADLIAGSPGLVPDPGSIRPGPPALLVVRGGAPLVSVELVSVGLLSVPLTGTRLIASAQAGTPRIGIPLVGLSPPVAALTIAGVRVVALRPPTAPPVAAEVPGRPGDLLAQAANGVPHILGDLARDVPHRLRQFLFQLGQVVEPGLDLLAALVGDPVDLAPVDLVVGDQAVLLEPGQPRVDGAGGGRVDTHEAILEQADDLVAVPRRLIEQLQQVQPEPAVPEDGAHCASPVPSGPGAGSKGRPVIEHDIAAPSCA